MTNRIDRSLRTEHGRADLKIDHADIAAHVLAHFNVPADDIDGVPFGDGA